MQRFLIGMCAILMAAVAFGQIRDSNGALVVPQLTGNANDVLKGDGTFGAGGSGESVPTGAILLIKSGSCPTGYTEDTDFNGKTIVGTLAANSNVGTTGGSDTITPAGSNAAPTFTGTPFSSVINHTHTVTVTDPGHTHTLPVGATDDTAAPFDRADAGTNASGANATTASGSGTTGLTASTANPAGGVASITPAGSVSAPTFTGTQFDNRSAFLRVIACRKT